jgi:CHAT domain-containing protein/Tfp pilus assembly protein PilF
MLLILGARAQVKQREPAPGVLVRRAGKLVLHTPVERELAAGQLDEFTIEAGAGKFARVVAEQKGVDVRVRIVAPQGKVLVTAARSNGAWGPNAASWIATESGIYKIRVFESNLSSQTGHYRIDLTDLRQPTQSDRLRIEAESRLFAAETELETGDKEKQLGAIQEFGRVASLWRELKDGYEEAHSLDLTGKAYWGLGDPREALDFHNQALPLFRALGDRDGEGLTLMCIGNDYSRLGEERQALEYYEEAQSLYRSVGDRANQANTLTNIGMVYSDIGEDQKALQNFKQALLLDRAMGNRRGEAATLGNIGSLYFDLGKMNSALDSFTRALSLFRALQDRLDQDRTLVNIGASYWELGETQEALQYYEQALPIERSLGDRDGEEKTLSNMGDLYARMGDNLKALDDHNQALIVERASQNRKDEASTLESLGQDYSAIGENEKALGFYYQALRLARAVSDPSMQALLLGNLMEHWRRENNPGLGIFFGKEAVNQYQDLRRNIEDLDPQLQRSYLATVTKTYRSLTDELIAQGRLAEAEQIVSLLKTQEYFDYIRPDAAEGAIEGHSNLNPEEAEWDRRYGEVADRLAAAANERVILLAKNAPTPEEARRLAQLEKELAADDEAFNLFFAELVQHFSDKPATALGAEQMPETQGMTEDLRELPAGTVAIYTLVGRDRFRSILRTPGGQKAYEYPIHEADLNRKVLAFRQAVKDPLVDPRPIAEQLYEIIVAPMAEDLREANAQTLMWSLDGVLRYLPLAALYDGKQYLIENYRVSVMTLASNTRLKDRPETEWKAAGFGVTKSYQGLPPLPLVSDELESIIATRPGDRGVLPGKIMLNEAFTKEAMRQVLLEGYPVVHIASHFRFQPGNVAQSYLLLGDGSHLSLSELKGSRNFFGNVELLTLSACDTGMSDGTEVEGFGALAEFQGAKAVIASLWPVTDSSTKILMQRFYRIRESTPGITKLEALREAQRELIDHSARSAESAAPVHAQTTAREASTPSPAKPRFPVNSRSPYAHPYYWAPFFLMGNWL